LFIKVSFLFPKKQKQHKNIKALTNEHLYLFVGAFMFLYWARLATRATERCSAVDRFSS